MSNFTSIDHIGIIYQVLSISKLQVILILVLRASVVRLTTQNIFFAYFFALPTRFEISRQHAPFFQRLGNLQRSSSYAVHLDARATILASELDQLVQYALQAEKDALVGAFPLLNILFDVLDVDISEDARIMTSDDEVWCLIDPQSWEELNQFDLSPNGPSLQIEDGFLGNCMTGRAYCECI